MPCMRQSNAGKSTADSKWTVCDADGTALSAPAAAALDAAAHPSAVSQPARSERAC